VAALAEEGDGLEGPDLIGMVRHDVQPTIPSPA